MQRRGGNGIKRSCSSNRLFLFLHELVRWQFSRSSQRLVKARRIFFLLGCLVLVHVVVHGKEDGGKDRVSNGKKTCFLRWKVLHGVGSKSGIVV